MSILVTGVAGFIGSHCAKYLVESGLPVVGIDNLSTGRKGNARWGSFVQGDIGDVNLVRQILRGYNVRVVLHLAAFAHVGESIASPEMYFENNVCATHALLRAMLSEGVRRFVFASSCSVYGVSPDAQVKEDEPVHPLSAYGESKLSIERSLPWYERAHGLNWLALRYFNVSGAEVGLPERETSLRIIPRSIHAALGCGPALQVFGTRYPTPDGTAVRDYVHVKDVVQANALAIHYLQAGKPSAIVNIGSGAGASVRQIIDTVSSVAGKPVPFIETESRAGDPASIVASPAKSRALLGWVPSHSRLSRIVTDAVKAYLSRADARTVSVAAASDAELRHALSAQASDPIL